MNNSETEFQPADGSCLQSQCDVPLGLVGRLYVWVIHWAETPYGTPALFAIPFAENSFFSDTSRFVHWRTKFRQSGSAINPLP